MADIAVTTAGRVEVIESIEQLTAVASAALVAGNVVYLNSDGKWAKADCTVIATAKPYGIVTRSAAAGEAVTAIRQGIMGGFTLDGAYGSYAWLSDTAGVMADAAGTIPVLVGSVVPVTGTSIGTAYDKVLRVDVQNLVQNPVMSIVTCAAATTLTVEQSGSLVVNTGAAGGIEVTLPQDATAGVWFRAVVTTAQQLQISPGAAGALIHGGTKQADDKHLWADALAESMMFVCVGDHDWITMHGTGTWTVEN